MSNSCNALVCSPLGSSVHGISQARILEWVTISFSRGSSQPSGQTCVSFLTGSFFTTEQPGKPSQFRDIIKWVKSLSRVRPSTTPWTAAFQAPPSMRFSRQEYWSGVPLPSPSYAPNQYKSLVLKRNTNSVGRRMTLRDIAFKKISLSFVKIVIFKFSHFK